MFEQSLHKNEETTPSKKRILVAILLSAASLLLPVPWGFLGAILAVFALIWSVQYKKETGKKTLGFLFSIVILIIQGLAVLSYVVFDGKKLEGVWHSTESLYGVEQQLTFDKDGSFEWLMSAQGIEMKIQADYKTRIADYNTMEWETYAVILENIDSGGLEIPIVENSDGEDVGITVKVKDDKAIVLDTEGNELFHLEKE